MKSLEKFIRENRAALDQREPSDGTWKKIESALDEKPSRSLWSNVALWRAAALLFFGLSIYLLTSQSLTTFKDDTSSLQTEFHDLENFYSTQIAEKVSLIDEIEALEPDDQYTQDIQKLEAMYQVLREQMKTKPSREVKDALILNLLVRIDLLNQQLKKLEDNKRSDQDQVDI